MIFEDRHTLHSGKAFEDLVCNVLKKFCSTDKSRLVIRVLLQVDYQELKKIEEFINSIGGTLGYYPDQTPRNPKPFWYTTFSINRSDRNPDVKTIQTLREINKKYIAKVLNNM